MRVLRAVFSTDHKVIAVQFALSGFVFLAVGGILAMVMRWQWAYPGQVVPVVGDLLFPESGGAVSPAAYTELFTSHGLIMIFFAITPILIGAVGNYILPLQIGARDMAFPRLNMLSFWLTAVSQVLALLSIVVPDGPSAGWTNYAPLSTGESAPGSGQTIMIVAIFAAGTATMLGAINYVTTVIAHRARGMGWMRLPLATWGIFLTAILNLLWVPVLGAATLLLFCDRVFATGFFDITGDPVLYQHLFWIFGHPEVYILILPVWGIVSDLVSFFARKPAFWYRGTVLAMVAVCAASGLVYGHHLFQTGMGPVLGATFELLTLAISAPAVVLFINWLCTLWRGQIELTAPMLAALGTMIVFGVGGLTGLYLGAISADIYLHDTLWVVGHFHLIMAAATLLGSFAAIYLWFPKVTGRRMNAALSIAHISLTVLLACATFGGLLWAGYSGQHRRLYDPFDFEFLAHLAPINKATTHAAFALGATQLLFLFNLVWSSIAGKPAGDNPWRLGTLEWQTSSPPPPQNFGAELEVHRGPHEFDSSGEPIAQSGEGGRA